MICITNSSVRLMSTRSLSRAVRVPSAGGGGGHCGTSVVYVGVCVCDHTPLLLLCNTAGFSASLFLYHSVETCHSLRTIKVFFSLWFSHVCVNIWHKTRGLLLIQTVYLCPTTRFSWDTKLVWFPLVTDAPSVCGVWMLFLSVCKKSF